MRKTVGLADFDLKNACSDEKERLEAEFKELYDGDLRVLDIDGIDITTEARNSIADRIIQIGRGVRQFLKVDVSIGEPEVELSAWCESEIERLISDFSAMEKRKFRWVTREGEDVTHAAQEKTQARIFKFKSYLREYLSDLAEGDKPRTN